MAIHIMNGSIFGGGVARYKLSVVVAFHNMRREAARTLLTLTAAYQRGSDAADIGVIALDTASRDPLDEAFVCSFGQNFRLMRFPESSPSPAYALNRGIAAADSDLVMCLIDGARMLSPGIFRKTLAAAQAFSDPLILTVGLHLGPKLQNISMLEGYDAAAEDALLATTPWREHGYSLFEISSCAASAPGGYFGPLSQSNCFAARRDRLLSAGGFDERFSSPGGGLVNLDIYNRLNEIADVTPVLLLGEGTFHQFHGGVATNVPLSEHPWPGFAREYETIIGRPYAANPRKPLYFGEVTPEAAWLLAAPEADRSKSEQPAMPRLGLPSDYIVRLGGIPVDDLRTAHDRSCPPEVSDVAEYFLTMTGRTKAIAIGSGRPLLPMTAERKIAVGCGRNTASHPADSASGIEWLEVDLSRPECLAGADLADSSSVVVCAGVIEHLPDPRPLLGLLAACYRRGAIVITSTPDRFRLRGGRHNGPPPDPSRVREWALDEYVGLLAEYGMPAVYAGYTIDDTPARENSAILSLHDRSIDRATEDLGAVRSPLAIIATYNEVDVIREVVEDLFGQGCDAIVIDNWSDDGSWEDLTAMANQYPDRLRIERFPADGPSPYFELQKILRRKETIAAAFPGRWILNTDADELRRSPFPALSLAQALAVAQRTGANRVSFNLVNFRPVDDSPYRSGTLRTHFTHFEYGTLPGHFGQARAWLQEGQSVNLASSGGHRANFPGARDFPYKFLLRHYPIRSVEHGRKKIFRERTARWSPYERNTLGWHKHYDRVAPDTDFIWNRIRLHLYDAGFWKDHGLQIITDIPQRRLTAKARARVSPDFLTPLRHARNIGKAAYEHSFGLRFINEAEVDPNRVYDAALRVILLDQRYGVRSDLAEKTVAVVGNGTIENCGRQIDAHDGVIRIATMRNWHRDPRHDGERISLWAGYPWVVVHRNAMGEPEPDAHFSTVVQAGVALWGLSSFHFSIDSYRFFKREGLLDRLLVAPPPSVICDAATGYLDGPEISEIFSIPVGKRGLIGLPQFDFLFTGTRLCLLLELSGVRHISLYGADLFTASPDQVWFGHDPAVDLKVLLALKRRLIDRGGMFYWHEEQAVLEKLAVP